MGGSANDNTDFCSDAFADANVERYALAHDKALRFLGEIFERKASGEVDFKDPVTMGTDRVEEIISGMRRQFTELDPMNRAISFDDIDEGERMLAYVEPRMRFWQMPTDEIVEMAKAQLRL